MARILQETALRRRCGCGPEKRCRVGIRVACRGGGGGGGDGNAMCIRVCTCACSGAGGGALVAFPRPLPGTIPGDISSSVCKISEFHVALFRYVTLTFLRPRRRRLLSARRSHRACFAAVLARLASHSPPLYRALNGADTRRGV